MVNVIPGPFVSPFPPQPYATVPFNRNIVNSKPPTHDERPRELSLPRYVNYLADYSGCGHWRMLWPEQLINILGHGCSSSLTAMVFDPRWYREVKAVKIQRQASSAQKEFVKFLKQIQPECGFKLIYEVDDVVFKEDIPDYNKFKFAFDSDEIRQNCIDIINMCDEVTVTCDFIRDLYKEKTGKQEITVVPNFIPHFWLGNKYDPLRVSDSFEKNRRKPRILYTGSGAHYDVENRIGGKDDFEQVLPFVINTRHKYQWIFVGAFPPPLLPYIQNREIEFHPWQTLLDYPSFIAGLEPQVMIAPLQDNNFNKSKSDIKFIESAILGIPCLCQDMCTYWSAPRDLKFSTVAELESKLATILDWKNKKQYQKNIRVLHEMGATRTMELPQNIGCHIEVLDTPYGSPNRKFLRRWNPNQFKQ